MRYAAQIEYDGSAYCGWQYLSHAASVQDVMEKALSKVANHPVKAHCSGRTDSGVHALGQIIHFDSDAVRDERAWRMGINSNLPDTVVLHWVKPVDDEFHARFSATARSYRYIILNRSTRPAILNKRVSWFRYPLDADLMHQAAQALLGENDFTSFRASGCQARNPNRNMHSISVTRQGDYIYVDIKANAFLYHMVRNIVGSLYLIGQGLKPVEWLGELLQAQDRKLAGPTAAADGLYFVSVDYPEQFALESVNEPPMFSI